MHNVQTPRKQGLFDPRYEHDACGIAMFANIRGQRSHQIIEQALIALERMNHRGGRGADDQLGDGAGILTELPDTFFRQEWSAVGKSLPQPGRYGVGMLFLPVEPKLRKRCEDVIEFMTEKEQLQIFGWRNVPTDVSTLGEQAIQSMPTIRQVFIASQEDNMFDQQAFERTLYTIRRQIEKRIKQELSEESLEAFHISSLSSRTIVYKGLLLPEQLKAFYTDLAHEAYVSTVAMVHNRFSTNTYPSWRRAQPNRYSLHNGEINTINGNINWALAREAAFKSGLLPDMDQLRPVIDISGSDSAMFDNMLELLVMSGRSIAHVMMMMIPEPWRNIQGLDDEKRAFYEYHSGLMEPWDGPAAMAFTDGLYAGACLDRNGLRPARYILTEDGYLYLSSESGVVDIPEEKIVRKDRLGPGQMLIVDLRRGALLLDEEVKQQVVSEQPYKQWLQKHVMTLQGNSKVDDREMQHQDSLARMQRMFGYTYEEVDKVLRPMALTGQEPTGSMGYDAPLAVLSKRPQLLFHYFKQRFAQVTNPPIDAIREELVTSIDTWIGSEGNLLELEPEAYHKIRLDTPVLTKSVMRSLKCMNNQNKNGWKVAEIPMLFSIVEEEGVMEQAIDEMLSKVDLHVQQGCQILVLSDREADQERAAIPSLLAISAVHQHLIHTGQRTNVSLIVESGEPREVHHFAALLGFGANAIYPYLVYASLPSLAKNELGTMSLDKLESNFVKAVSKGILKIMSKIGISVLQSYIGAQIFEAIGIRSDVMERYFPWTSSQIGGLSLEEIARETRERHVRAYSDQSTESLDPGSDLQWRVDGETHIYRPETIHMLQQACRTGDYSIYRKYSQMLQDDAEDRVTLRELLEIKRSTPAISLDEVEPVTSIVRRFKSGAMSFGSISQEAHEAIAIAMNRIGAKSNSGEGGEDPERYNRMPNGDWKRSAIKQVASGRFGVSSHYLVNSDEIQIKMAQGAKPGEGGQLAGHKVTPQVAKTRGSIPGIELISPPPHHDIYSIEDLAQLIHDLKHANPRARINVKLVSEAGVGTIAAGVAKAKADVILISGYDGGTGAASRTSIKHAGMPWELGLSEAHQTLMLNGLRSRVRLEVDGKLMNGRDVVIAALLGAEEFGFSTLPLVSLGCVMMRVCHLDTCPVGIATQNPELRRKMVGTPEHVENLMLFIAQEVREYMAELGFRSMDEMIGRSDLLQSMTDVRGHWKSSKLDLSALLHQVDGARKCEQAQDHDIDQSLDSRMLLPIGRKAWEKKKPVYARIPVRNTDRAIGTLLGSELTRTLGAEGLPDNAIHYHLQGTAGHSFGAFLPQGITLELEGEANDGVGKGLSGGRIILYPDAKSKFRAEEQVIIGNAAFYGATAGEAFILGRAGERFCVRNSGATVVVEGIGDHGCEYMTGGTVVILGEIGKNFAAGMSGGVAYVLDGEDLREHCHPELVSIERLADLDAIVQDEVYRLIEQHAQITGSQTAEHLIQRWELATARLVRVIPREYERLSQLTIHRNEVNVHG